MKLPFNKKHSSIEQSFNEKQTSINVISRKEKQTSTLVAFMIDFHDKYT
jgi:hypothetical protein